MPSGALITIPTYPPAPASIEPAYNRIASSSVSIFTGQQQTYDFGAGPMEISLSLPPMVPSVGGPWIVFLKALHGQVNYFTLTAAFIAGYPELDLAGRYWRLKGNQSKYPLSRDRTYLITLDCREATS